MLQKISRVKKLGVFSDYSWDPTLPPFGRYNVIYGENGSGKTTLSRLLGCLNSGGSDEYPELEFKIESDSGDLHHGVAARRKVRVFNADYVQLNIGQLDGSLKPILVLGEENKAVAEELAADQSELERRMSIIARARETIAVHDTARGRKFSDVAKVISEAISGATLRTYRKNNAEDAYKQLSNTTALTEEELEAHRTTVHQQMMDKVREPMLEVPIGQDDLTVSAAALRLSRRAEELCGRTAAADAIARLRDHSDIAAWVEAGRALHMRHKSTDCEFCGQAIPASRWAELEAHFNEADLQLKHQIERSIEDALSLRRQVAAVTLPDRLAFYSDIRERYDAARTSWDAACQAALGRLDAAVECLNIKLQSRSTAMPFNASVSLDVLERAMTALVGVIRDHNNKTESFDAAKTRASKEVEAHYLLSIRDEVTAFGRKIAAEEKVISDAENGAGGNRSLSALEASIYEKKTQLSNAHKGGAELTRYLQTFLGRSDLVFHSGNDGYRVQRYGKPAIKLSEGERTAIAFIYFVVQLRDQEFSLPDGIVVIDDPVSSLDSSSVYQAFAFLKNNVKEAKQVFLLTHNFGFLRLVLDWLRNDHKSKRQYYMLVCRSDAHGRHARIVKLDQALIEHPTEYHFLFKTLVTFQNDGTIAGCYHIPNIVRKVLETFLEFYAPDKKTLFSKLESVSFDMNKKTAIYKYSNGNSHFTGHAFEPALVQESQNNVTYLLEMIRTLAPRHYDGMIAAIQ